MLLCSWGDYMNIGEKIKEKREKLGISQRELARRIEMSGQMISKIESGSSTPSIDTINKIAAILNVQVSALLDDNNEESFSYKLICDIEKACITKSKGSIPHDIFQVLSDDLEIDYQDFDDFQIKKAIYTKDNNGSYIYDQIVNENLNKTKDLPISHIRKLLAYYNDLDNYNFRKLCLNIFYDNIPVKAEIKKVISEFLRNNNNDLNKDIEDYSEFMPENMDKKHKNYNTSEYYRYLEIRIMELAANSNMNINNDTTNEIIKNIDALIDFELYKLKTKVNSSKENQ